MACTNGLSVELLAVHFATTHLRPYIYGRHFIVNSDHKPLIYLYNLKNPSSRLSRIRLELEECDFEIRYVRGKDNVVADVLSRIIIDELMICTGMNKFSIKSDRGWGMSNTIQTKEHPNVYEDYDTGFLKNVPRLQTNCISFHREGNQYAG